MRTNFRAHALFLAFAFLLPALPAAAHDFEIGDLAIGHPWSRATPAGAKVAAGYMTIRNAGATADRLVSVTAEIAGRAEIHEMAVDGNGVMTMRPLAAGIEIPAGGEVALKPGSFHLMFMELNQPAKEGAPFKGTVTFEKAGTLEIEFAVEKMGGPAGGHDGAAPKAHGG